MFLVVSRSDVLFIFEHPFFMCPIGRACKIALPKNRAPRKKVVHPCQCRFENFTICSGSYKNNALKEFRSYLPANFVFFLKSRPIFKRFYCFCMFVNKHFTNTGAYISKSKRCQNGKPSAYYFHIKTKISLDFHICISVPLMLGLSCKSIISAT